MDPKKKKTEYIEHKISSMPEMHLRIEKIKNGDEGRCLPNNFRDEPNIRLLRGMVEAN